MRKPITLLLLISALALALAYQFRAPLALEMASPAEEIYLTRGFYPNEETAGVTFRWTSGEAQATLPGVGGGVPLKLHLQLQEFRPAPLSPHPVTITLNGQPVASFTPAADLAAYDFDLPPADLRGDAVVDLRSDAFRPKDALPNSTDERDLGVFVDQIKLDYGAGLIVPPLLVYTLLIASVLGAYGLSKTIGLSQRASFVIAVILLIAEAIGVIGFRLWIAHNSAWIAATTIGAWLIAARLQRGKRHAPRASGPLGAPTPIPHSTFGIPNSAITFMLAVVLMWRIVLVLIPILGNDIEGTRECCPEVLPQPVTSWSQAAFGTWHRWDALWYSSIAAHGYQYAGEREAANVAFFPLFPMVNGAIMRVTGLPVEVSGALVSTLVTFFACLVLYKLTIGETDDPGVARRSVLYLIAFPAAYYLAIGYSEALYLLCVLGAFYLARRGQWWWSGAVAFLAGLARLHGALLIVPLGYEWLRQSFAHGAADSRPPRASALAVFGAPLGVLAFNLYLNAQFGQPAGYFSPYFQIQTMFFKGIRAEAFPTFPGTTLANYLFGFLNGVPSTESAVVMAATIFLLIMTVEVWARLPRVYGVYMLTVLLFQLVGGDLISMPRFVVPLFPAFIALAQLGRREWVDRLILIPSLLLQGVLALLFTKGYWIA
jgi:Gpi18-like mannosyltransferase